MIFKTNWERTETRVEISDTSIKVMINTAVSEKELDNYLLMSGGCANLNFKLNFKTPKQSLVLRVFLRDKSCALKEQKISDLINDKIPVPQVYYVGELAGYTYAIIDFKPGITLRDLLLDPLQQNGHEAVYETGKMLSTIASYQFSSGGFFDANLNINSMVSSKSYLEYALDSLTNQIVKEQLNENQIDLIKKMLQRYNNYFPDKNQKSLVHADYDPANILVDKISGKWQITAILDWEFAFSGSNLCDVANMLRYAHKMPVWYEEQFILGLKENGYLLPDNWKISIYLLNILSLLDCLANADPTMRPNQCLDIIQLLNYFTSTLSEINLYG